MLGAAMPETTVDKHKEAYAAECDVRPSPPIEWQRRADTKPQTARVEQRSHQRFRAGVAATIGLHVPRRASETTGGPIDEGRGCVGGIWLACRE